MDDGSQLVVGDGAVVTSEGNGLVVIEWRRFAGRGRIVVVVENGGVAVALGARSLLCRLVGRPVSDG